MIEIHRNDSVDETPAEAPTPGFHVTVNKPKTRHLKQLIKTNGQSRTLLRFGAVVLVLSVLLSLISPLLIRRLVDQFRHGVDWRLLIAIGALMIGSTALAAWGNYLFSAAGLAIVQETQNQTLAKILAKPVAFFDQTPSGQLTSRLTNNLDQIKNYYTAGYPSLISGIVTIIGAVGMLVYMNGILTLLLVGALLIMYGLLSGLANQLGAPMDAFLDEAGHYTAGITEAFANIRLIKANTAEHQITAASQDKTAAMRREGLRVAKVMSRMQPIMSTILLLILGGTLAVGGYFVSTNRMTNGTLISFLVLVIQVANPMLNFSSYSASQKEADSAAKNLLAQLAAAGEDDSPKETKLLTTQLQHQPLALHQVSLDYGNGHGVHDLDLTLIPNQLYALVGPSGAGKSTLMAVLERFYTPTSGTLQVGDTPAACFALTAWRQHLAYVPQTSEVLSGTYRAYLQLAAPQASDADLNQALAAVQLTDFIASLPAGLDSQIAEAGTNMSGGQKQRLTIAQALLKKADIYLFDEITANLDADSEAIIRDLIRQLAATHTVLAAAHRLSSVRDADQVIVLENGRITGQGTPAELLTRNTTYARFVQEQSLA